MIALLAALRSTAGIAALAALLAGAAGLGLGWRYASAQGAARLAHCQQRHADAVAAAEVSARHRIEAAQASADTALLAERQRLQAANQTTEELRHALRRVATDRACLGAPARRLLNQSPGIAATGLPTHPGVAAGPAAAAAAHPGQPADAAADTTEADTADWIARAAGQYEACRARVDAIADWQRGVTDAR